VKLEVLPAVTFCTDVGPVNPNPVGVVPVSGSVCMLGVRIIRDGQGPMRVPAAVGVKVTLIVQFAPAASGMAGVIGKQLSRCSSRQSHRMRQWR